MRVPQSFGKNANTLRRINQTRKCWTLPAKKMLSKARTVVRRGGGRRACHVTPGLGDEYYAQREGERNNESEENSHYMWCSLVGWGKQLLGGETTEFSLSSEGLVWACFTVFNCNFYWPTLQHTKPMYLNCRRVCCAIVFDTTKPQNETTHNSNG